MYRIYCYTNLITNQKYVGCTCRKQDRRAGKNGSGYKVCPKFNEAIQQYGWNNFEYSVLEDNLSKEQSELREQFWISELNTIFPNGYNLQSGGKHFTIDSEYSSMYGQFHPEEVRKKISNSMKGRNVGEQNPMYGRTGSLSPSYSRKHTEEERNKISETLKGRTFTEEWRNNISKSLIGKLSGEAHPLYGTHHSSETKKKISDKIKGRHWFHNNEEEAQLYECPEGWFTGRLRKVTN